MKIKKLALMSIYVTMIFSSCKKDTDSKSSTTSTPESVVGTWKITTQTMTANGTTEDLIAQREPCEKDDLLKFDMAHNMFVGCGAIKCDPSEPEFVSQGTWALRNSNTTFLMFQGDTTVASIEILNATTFKFKITEVDDTDTSILNTTLTRQ